MLENYPGREKYGVSEIQYISKKFPHSVIRETPSIDQMICLFLREHDVYVQPPEGTGVLDGALTGAITGAYGVEAGATVSLANNQNKIAAKQEWTSWKQWTLSHPDWKGFRERSLKIVDDSNSEALSLWADSSFRKDVAELVAERNRLALKNNIQVLKLAAFIVALIVGWSYLAQLKWEKKDRPISPAESVVFGD